MSILRDILISVSILASWVWLGYRYEVSQDEVTMTACSVVTVPQEVEL